ncbi:MAG: fibrobacter succinogenes major paralogous domain-containing protein [Candidatus Saccharibacteria bacterium]|nr:fibrobacter succinogenes major paralogous domain-containing protein [Candidatus Saccharibacteria bacterium]
MKKFSKALAIFMLALSMAPLNVFAESKTAGVKVSIPESLTLTLNTNNLSFALEDSDLHTDIITITAKTNSAAGYTISFNANNDYNDLKHSNILVGDKIESIAEDKTATTFPETAWAYSTDLSDYIFKQIPLAAKNIFATTEKGENSHDLTVGVRANNLASGDYENELIFTAVANPEPSFANLCNKEALDIDDAICMQDINDDIKASMIEERQYQLMDSRDGKIYWVAKLKDGNVWMTQNLDLNLNTETTLTPADSDITENWTPSHTTIVGAANLNSTNWANDNNVPYSFDPENYYFDGSNSGWAGCNYLTTTCDHFSTTSYTQNGEHGHVGNYYNWSAAVASNNTSATTEGTDMETSICPKGWRLPHGYQSPQENDFETLTTAYSETTNSDSAILASPLFFVHGGSILSGTLHDAPKFGYYWTSTASSDNYADRFHFYSNLINPAVNASHSFGHSIRCLAR